MNGEPFSFVISPSLQPSTPPHPLTLSMQVEKTHSETFIERLKRNLPDCRIKKVIYNIKLTFIYMQITPPSHGLFE